MKHFTALFSFLLVISQLSAQQHLPPTPIWNGKSLDLMLSKDADWATPFELSDGNSSASIIEMRNWFGRLRNKYSQVNELVIGQTINETEILAYTFSEDPAFSVSLHRSNKPLVVFQAGIHSGEIDGLDAGMMLFRDLCTGSLKSLAKQVDIIFIPVINIDGLTLLSDKNRINQRGPEMQGWRSNSLNQNLNRDYSKLDSYEIKAVVELISVVKPELYVDIHVTDGADYQYDITYGFQGDHAYSPNISRWLARKLRTDSDRKLSKLGHIPGDLVFLKDEKDPLQGNQLYTFGARFSHGYGDARHLPTVLVENHSLKPFKQRVLGTRVLMEAMLEAVSQDIDGLRKSIKLDENNRQTNIPITWEIPAIPKDSVVFKSIKSTTKFSEAAGGNVTSWNAEKLDVKIPLIQQNQPKTFINRPKFYCIPANRTDIRDRLKSHGIEHRILESDSLIEVNCIRFENFQLIGKTTNQGRTRMSASSVNFKKKVIYRRGSTIVSTDQPLGILSCLLLEPDSPDSFFQWGFFGDVAERTEYFEAYAMAPLADEMMKNNPELKAEFDSKCASDEAFRKDQDARLRWWYEHSEWSDENWMVYPIGTIN
jgi:hypothetical protein